jgi:glutathione synthase/RimK-type ligase-like ATP-grasp enzyme
MLSFKIGILTCAAIPRLSGEDMALMLDLNSKGHRTIPLVWNDSKVDWSAFDCLLFRSVWDYHKNIDEFRSFLRKIESLGVPCFNPINTIIENMDKNYLRKLQDAGVRIIPSVFIEKGIAEQNIFTQLNTEEIILKPTVSASSYNLHKFNRSEQAALDAVLENTKIDFIAQPFMKEIKETGELSFVFIDGLFSHAMRKLPKKDDFRVQKEYGAKDIPFVPDDNQIRYAMNALRTLCSNSLYARVDCLMGAAGQYIMEVELFEPLLYLDTPTIRGNLILALENRLTLFMGSGISKSI